MGVWLNGSAGTALVAGARQVRLTQGGCIRARGACIMLLGSDLEAGALAMPSRRLGRVSSARTGGLALWSVPASYPPPGRLLRLA